MLTAALLALFNMARGNDTIPQWGWLVLSAWLIVAEKGVGLNAFFWFLIVCIVTIRGTGPTLLIGINGDKRAITEGLKRNCWVIPALAYLHAWWGLCLLLQGGMYWVCGRIVSGGKSTRVAEGISGAVLGLLISVGE